MSRRAVLISQNIAKKTGYLAKYRKKNYLSRIISQNIALKPKKSEKRPVKTQKIGNNAKKGDLNARKLGRCCSLKRLKVGLIHGNLDFAGVVFGGVHGLAFIWKKTSQQYDYRESTNERK